MALRLVHLHDQVLAILRSDLPPRIHFRPIEYPRSVELASTGEHLAFGHRPPCADLGGPVDKALPRVLSPQRYDARRHDLRTLGDENGRRRGMCRPSGDCALFSRFPTTSWWAKISAAPFGAGSTSEACGWER